MVSFCFIVLGPTRNIHHTVSTLSRILFCFGPLFSVLFKLWRHPFTLDTTIFLFYYIIFFFQYLKYLFTSNIYFYKRENWGEKKRNWKEIQKKREKKETVLKSFLLRDHDWSVNSVGSESISQHEGFSFKITDQTSALESSVYLWLMLLVNKEKIQRRSPKY